MPWTKLPVDDWTDTLETLHLWTQVVGKIRLSKAPWLNHSWNVPLYVTSSGLGTSLVPHGQEGFDIEFDFQGDELRLRTTTGERRTISLEPRTVADFHEAVLGEMESVGMPVEIHPIPSEIADAIPFHEDTVHAAYDPEHARALWRALLDASRVMQGFRAGFRGKASPVHFFWGSFDLAVTRFSGRPAPDHPGGMPNFPDDVAREAYSHEVTSCGLWPGNREAPTPIFYSYAYPTPEGFADAKIAPDAAFWLAELGEFAVPYDAIASADDPEGELLAFFESTHAAAADLAGWDRDSLECDHPHGPEWWRQRPHA
ncbi:MAG: DUF5996 family protein [Planctomycetota bacterium]